MADKEWFCISAGRRTGPLTLDELLRMLALQPEPRQAVVWRTGLASWTTAGVVPELAPHLPPPVPEYHPGSVAASPPALLGRLNPKFALFAILLSLALVASVLFAKSAGGTYDSSGPCLLAGQYTKVTRGSSVSYRVSYGFVAHGRQYAGKDTIYHEPTSREATVYYMARDPRDNGLSRNRLNDDTLALAGVAFLVAILAYWRLPAEYFKAPAGAMLSKRSGPGDSGGEHLRMERGKYDASFYVGLAFLGQVGLVSVLLALGFSLFPGASATDDVVLVLATLGGVASTLWVYLDRWLCIEAYASKFCSGCANISIAYVPVAAFLHANYRAVMRLRGR